MRPIAVSHYSRRRRRGLTRETRETSQAWNQNDGIESGYRWATRGGGSPCGPSFPLGAWQVRESTLRDYTGNAWTRANPGSNYPEERYINPEKYRRTREPLIHKHRLRRRRPRHRRCCYCCCCFFVQRKNRIDVWEILKISSWEFNYRFFKMCYPTVLSILLLVTAQQNSISFPAGV